MIHGPVALGSVILIHISISHLQGRYFNVK